VEDPDGEDEFEDAIDEVLEPEQLNLTSALSEAGAQPLSESKDGRTSFASDLLGLGADERGAAHDLLQIFRASHQDEGAAVPPVFRGCFVLENFTVCLVQDESEDRDDGASAGSRAAPRAELVHDARQFVIHYSHYDSKDARNKDQIVVEASCADAGVRLVDGDRSEELAQRSAEGLGGELLTIGLRFGNQRIKEALIAKLDHQKVAEFVDQAVSLRFKPVTLTYSRRAVAFLSKFAHVEAGLNEEVRLRALEEYEKLRVSVMKMNEKEMQSLSAPEHNLRLQVQLESSQLILPIRDGADSDHERWVVNTGNLVLTNLPDHFEEIRAEDGYRPLNVQITQTQVVLARDRRPDETLLEDFNLRVLILLLEKSRKGLKI
jgi:hypothetical protein